MSYTDPISISVSTEAAEPVVIVFPGPRAMCSCGWMGKPRWFRYGAVIDAQIHHADTGHGLAAPLVWGNHR